MRVRRNVLYYGMLIIGVCLFLCPTASNFIQKGKEKQIIARLHNVWKGMDVNEQRKLARDYNDRLITAPETLSLETYYSILDAENGIMGYISIPKIQMELPIYHGVSDEVLRKGVGHIPESAFPVGGEGTHSVLAGHTGLPSAKLFSDLTELETGDLFQIYILGETITYQVDQIKTVLPDNIEDLLPKTGKEYCTLVTCTPYGINTHRLLVRGQRTEE